MTLSSARPRMRVVPSAKAAATARIGYSSIIEGARSGGTSTPFNGPWRSTRSATGSPAWSRGLAKVRSAPISRKVSNRPARRGLMPTAGKVTSEPGTRRAATTGKAAEEGSAGTRTFCPVRSGWPLTLIARPPLPSSSTFTFAPKPVSIFSVWSRVASCSITVVVPGVLSPASRIADLTWAEATGSS